MNSPPLVPKSKSSLPTRLLNGGSPLHSSAGAKERQRLAASIDSSNSERQPINLYSLNGTEPKLTNVSHSVLQSDISEAARDPRDEAPQPRIPTVSRPASPYTLNPPIDFDGLSWPSKSLHLPSHMQEKLMRF